MNKIDKIIFVVWQILLLACLVIPLLFSGRFFFPYVSTKVFAFRILVELSLLLAVILYLRGRIALPPKSRLLYAILAYVGVMTIASIFGLDLYKSLWSGVERSEGLLLLYHLVAWMVMLPLAFSTEKLWRYAAYVSGATSLAVSIYGFLQIVGASFIEPSGGRIGATLGNAAYLGAYLLPHIFLFIWAAIKSTGWQRYTLIAAAVFESYIVFSTQTRGATLGLILGFLVLIAFSLVYAWRSGSAILKKAAGGTALVFVLLVVGVFAARNSDFVQSQGTLRRITNISTEDTTSRNRLATWEASIKAWKDRPVLGYGYENFNIGFNKYFPAVIYEDSGSQVWFDRAHNVIFDQLVAGGVFGLAAYLAIWILVFTLIWRLYKQGQHLKAVIFLAIVVSYLFQNLFVFDSPASYVSIFALLSYWYWLDSQKQRELAQAGKKRSWAPFGYAAAAVFVALVIWQVNVLPLKANLKLALAGGYQNAANAQNLNAQTLTRTKLRAAQLFSEAAQTPTYVRFEARGKFVEFLAFHNQGMSEEDIVKYFDQALEAARKNIDEQPYNALYYLQLMSLLNQGGSIDLDYVKETPVIAQKALELSPTRPQTYHLLGYAQLTLGAYNEAIESFQKALALNSKPFESQWNLVLAYAYTNQPQKTQEQIEKLINNGYARQFTADRYSILGRIYVQAGNYAEAEKAFKKAFEMEKNNLDYFVNYAISVHYQGRTNEAIEMLESIKVSAPHLSTQVDNLISQIRSDN